MLFGVHVIVAIRDSGMERTERLAVSLFVELLRLNDNFYNGSQVFLRRSKKRVPWAGQTRDVGQEKNDGMNLDTEDALKKEMEPFQHQVPTPSPTLAREC